jgi:hypothetical protein
LVVLEENAFPSFRGPLHFVDVGFLALRYSGEQVNWLHGVGGDLLDVSFEKKDVPFLLSGIAATYAAFGA